ncbi:uncharacterized protein LOC121427546 [Lytechinus variegatus]|uniref:uncharacterized protein LOC121427546 n=1 Tax=Lytechinus variegatus TaxID=7654 RepID=UPI001BB187E6|nr:uncharacterized protein LOC121427546 [Lytechinus variegatus]XP_041479928.1 uncharacterized protein LOC121427546 [Lytechinus variegatus]XP_041479929.1 uncharacterized protein LOC121427546 [Lytechinus variegatus]XP_041479930.1 uncharacterized protein LOC121427546 [Lytechinus variegatus]
MTAKINFSNDHLEKLKVWFDINPNPGRVQVDHIASQIGSLSAHVWIWFHRQRKRVEANPEASPLKVKTISRSKGTLSSLPKTDSLSTRSFSKRLESNSRRDQDVRKHGKEMVDPKCRRQERLKAKKGVVRGIQRKAETRQRVGLRSAEGCFKGAEREVGRRQGMHVTFAEDVEVSRMQESGVMQKLDPVQNCSERMDKVGESLEHRRLRSSPRKSTTPVIGDCQELCDTKLCEEHLSTGDKDSHYQGSARKSAPGSMSRIVKELDNQKSMRKKSMPMSEKKVLREADSQNLGVQMSTVRRENTESREHFRVNRTTQDGFSRTEKVLEKKHSALNFKKADHAKQCLPSDKTKAKVLKKVDAGGIITRGGRNRIIESEGNHRKVLITHSACIDETSKAERKNERQINVSVTRRKKVTENFKSAKSEHHRAAELNLRHLKPQQPLTKVSSSSNSRVKSKSKTKKEKAILAQKTNLLKNKMKGDDVCQAAIDSGKPKVPSIMPVGKRRSREGLFSAISMPQAKAQVGLSDSSDAEDFQDDCNKKNHKLSKKKVVTTVTTDSLNNGKSIPVLSGKRQNIALADCSNRVTAGRNLKRIPLESANEIHCANKNKKAVSPVKCGVSSTVSSQSSVISSTVEETSVPQNCCEHISKPPYSPLSISGGKDKPCLLQEKKIKQKKTEEEFVKKSGPVISDDKIWNPYSGEFLFKRELSVNLIKINLSSNSDEREVMVSSKMNPTNQQKENKEDNQLWKDDRTDINSNMSENMSSHPKVAERSIWNSIAASVETSSKIWQSIASSTEASPKEIPFIDGSSCLDKKSTDLWSSIASSVEMSHKDIPFIERSISPEGESTPSSSQDTVACNEDPCRAKTKSMFDEDSCEVSSSVDLEKVPSVLSEVIDGIEESEETSLSNLVETNEGKDTAADVIEAKEDNVKFSEGDTKSMKEVEKISASEKEVNVEEHEKPAIDVSTKKYESSKVDSLKTKKNFRKTTLAFIESSKKAEISSNNKDFFETHVESPKVIEMDRKDLLEPERNSGGSKTAGTLEEVSPAECHKMSANVMENSEIGPDEENASAGEKPASPVDDLYETIDSPDYDIGSPYVVVDEIGGSDTEENTSTENGRQEESSEDHDCLNISIKPFPEFVNKSTKASEIIDLDCSDDDEVVLISLTSSKKARRIPIGDNSLKGHLSSHNKNQLEVIDLDCNSEDDVIQVSTVAPNTPTSLGIETSDCLNVTEKQSIQNDVPSVEVNGTSLHPPTLEQEQPKEQNVSQSTETESSKHDAVLDMTCETVSIDCGGCVDNKSPEIFSVLTPNNECNESMEIKDSSSDKLVIEMEKCDKVDCPLQEQDVPTSLKDISDEPVDQSDGGKDSPLDELVIDMEACRKMDCPPEDQGVPTSLKSSLGDPMEQSVGHNNSPSDELVIGRETCNKIDSPQKDQGVPASRKNAVDDEIGQTSGLQDSPSDELVIDIEACDKMYSLQLDQGVPTAIENAVNDQVVQSIGHKDSSSDELVIDMKPRKNLIRSCPDQGISNLENDAAAKINPSPLGIGSSDSLADELVIDMEACEKVNNSIQDKGIPASLKGADLPDNPSKESVKCNDSNSDTLVIDMKECDKMDSLQLDQGVSTFCKDDPVEQSVGRKDSSDELVIDMKHCDKVNDPCLDQDISTPLEHNTTRLNPSELGAGCSDSSADELVIDMEACDKMEYFPKEQEAPEGTNHFPVDPSEDNIQHKLPDSCECKPGSSADSRLGALEGLVNDKSDQVEQDAEMEKSDESVKVVKVCGELIGLLKAMDSPKRTVPTFSKINTPQRGNEVGDLTTAEGGPVEYSVTANTPSGKNEATSSSDAIEDKLHPAKQRLGHHDATSDDDVLIDVVTADPSECPLSITMFKNSADTSPDSLIPSAAKTCASDENSKNLVADVLDKDQMEDPVTNSLEPSGNQETPGNDTTDQSEDQDLKSTKGCALSCDDSKCQEDGDSSSLGSSATIGGGPPQTVLSRDTPEKQLPESGIQIKSEPDAGAVEDTPSGSVTPDEESKQANKENPQEKMKRPKSLNQLVSALTQRLGLIAKSVTPSPSNLDLPRSTVGINHKASHSKPSSSPTEGALQPPKPTQEPGRGTKRRMITNKNLKRPPIPEKVQMRIQQLNPYPCDHGWQHNAAVVELAQREVELDCQPGDQVALTGPPVDQLLGTRGSTPGNVNFCYQRGIDPVNTTSRDTSGVPVTTKNDESGSQPVSPQGNSTQVVESHPLLTGMLTGADAGSTEPLKRKRSRTASGNSKRGKNSRRRRRKSSDDVAWEISSRADALENGTFSEKDIREEWMQLLKVMEESTQSGNEEQLSNSEIVLPSSSIPASASERLPGHQADCPVEGLPSMSVQESDTSSITDTASGKDDLSGMPSILRVFSLRDEEPENNLALESTGLGSFDLDSARIIETQDASQVYSIAAAAAAATAARRHSRESCDYTVSSQQEMSRKRRSSQTFGSADGVPPPKVVAAGSNSAVGQVIQANSIISSQQVPSRVCNQSGNLPDTLQPIAASGMSQTVLNSPVTSPTPSGMQNTTVLPSQPASRFIPVQPTPLQQVSQQRRGSLESLLNPLILNQQIQNYRLSASPPLCTPYPTTSGPVLHTVLGPSAPSGNIQNPGVGYLGGSIPLPTANVQWTEAPPNVQLAPVTTQSYTNGVDSRSTIFYTPQVSTVTFLTGSPR